MAEIAARSDQVAHALLEHLGLGKAAIGLALPDLHSVAGDAEHPAAARLQADPGEILTEGAEQLLGQPGGTQQPLCLLYTSPSPRDS